MLKNDWKYACVLKESYMYEQIMVPGYEKTFEQIFEPHFLRYGCVNIENNGKKSVSPGIFRYCSLTSETVTEFPYGTRTHETCF